MNSNRKILLLIISVFILLFVFACAGAAADKPPDLQPTQSAIGEPSEEDTPAEEPSEPQPTHSAVMDGVPPTPMVPDTGGGDISPVPAINENRRLTLEFSPSIRLGDSTRIRMTLEVDDLGGITPTAEIQGNVVTGETVSIPNLYDTHIVMAEAKLNMAGVAMDPAGTISEPLKPGRAVTFYWTVRPPEAGKYEGTAWLHLRFIPISSQDGEQEDHMPISAQFITLEVRSLLGLSGGIARGLGAAGSVVGAVVGFPFFDDVIRWLWRRFKG
jgi:hypothetical protein